MGDRVSFATLEEYFDVISVRQYHISGFNGFPFAIPTVAVDQVGFGTLYPFGMSLADAVKAYWRVKSWTITIAFDWPFEANDPPPGSHTGPYPYNSDWPTDAQRLGFNDDPIESESDLGFGPGFIDSNNDSTSNFCLFLPEEVSGWFGQAVKLEGSDLIYPASLIDIESDSGPSAYNDANDYPAGTGRLMNKYEFELRAADTGWSGTLTIVPAEFWSYATKNGSDVYDSNTGTRLVDPFS